MDLPIDLHGQLLFDSIKFLLVLGHTEHGILIMLIEDLEMVQLVALVHNLLLLHIKSHLQLLDLIILLSLLVLDSALQVTLLILFDLDQCLLALDVQSQSLGLFIQFLLLLPQHKQSLNETLHARLSILPQLTDDLLSCSNTIPKHPSLVRDPLHVLNHICHVLLVFVLTFGIHCFLILFSEVTCLDFCDLLSKLMGVILAKS